ncbi:metallophosphoesterase [Phaeobacter gallaeciensis]|uniref:Phosphoesterase or phosphohydrolase n=1 Tax=Phaeobacter gallaeciensis TaxID=60890 RepID=A0AAC9ZA72_9RHOB|nr:metallophosphoesterase [Phaeobacter gallaeciensis]AHD10534.1 putative phosphoesterase or phosphohydrolase [Phaeobacter gallaeciensis DSM 26640]ATE93797.1 putative phosphoesterase or phosphohydrolase [Phaeobacter gallaeciensis]ATE96382.1 putative phosphoesterase or phosphohydrolase [Phaeobacter gallaeciensis]ATF02461.1 putative phosphoesterase or phosphohydrolase [Phaeobacter gallaeciensis]ATF06841.1 putative phosphoesterase or phosphohydrolase [Phaeobacter gallaeciensis]
MTIWYTADTHFGHENIMRFCKRPFKSASQMDAALLENMWKVVGTEDQLWILGDFAFSSRAKDSAYVEQIFNQLPGAERHLVVGNHDLKPTLELPWDSISHLVELLDGPGNQPNTLCHYPMITWNHVRKGGLQFFGHVHDSWRGSRNSVNIGVDVWDFMPVTFADIARRAKNLPPNKHWGDVEYRAKLNT